MADQKSVSGTGPAVSPSLVTYHGIPWALVKGRNLNVCLRCESKVRPGRMVYRPLRSGEGVCRHYRMCEKCGGRCPSP